MGSDSCKTYLKKNYKGPDSINKPWFANWNDSPKGKGSKPNSEAPDNSGPYTFIEPQSIFGACNPNDYECKSKLPSWWNIGQSYLIVNQLLAQNVQRLVDNINMILGDGNGDKFKGYHLKEALDAFAKETSVSVIIPISDKIIFGFTSSCCI